MNPAPLMNYFKQIKKRFFLTLPHLKNKNYNIQKRCGVNLIILIVILLVNFSLSSAAQAGIFEEIIKGFKSTGQEAGFPVVSSGAPKVELIPAWTIYINGTFLLLGIIFLVMILYGGFLWMTARGGEEQVVKAKDLIKHATIGLMIVIFSRIIAEFIIFQLGQSVALQ